MTDLHYQKNASLRRSREKGTHQAATAFFDVSINKRFYSLTYDWSAFRWKADEIHSKVLVQIHKQRPQGQYEQTRFMMVHVLCCIFWTLYCESICLNLECKLRFLFCQPVQAQQRRQGGSKMTSSTCIRHTSIRSIRSHVKKSLSDLAGIWWKESAFSRLFAIILRKFETGKIKATSVYVAALAAAPFHEIGLSAHSAQPWAPGDRMLGIGLWRHMRRSHITKAMNLNRSLLCNDSVGFCWILLDLDLIWRFLSARAKLETVPAKWPISIAHQTCFEKPRTCEIIIYPREGTPFEDHRCEDYSVLHFRFVGSER